MLVSVVLPYRDRAGTLAEAATSVLRQTHTDIELILIDDCSTDDSSEVAHRLTDTRIRHLRSHSRLGQCGARNLGIDAATGRYLAFQDSDDVWEGDKLETQLRLMDGAPPGTVAAVGCTSRRYGRARGDTPSGPVRSHVAEDVLRGCVQGAGTPMLLLDRQVADSAVRFDTSFTALEERDYLLRSLGDRRLLVEPASLVQVRRGLGNHVATPVSALAGYERLLAKYSAEFERLPQARDWHRYQAMREALRAGSTQAARGHYRSIATNRGVVLWCEYLLGRLSRRYGADIAHHLHLHADWSSRCTAPTLS